MWVSPSKEGSAGYAGLRGLHGLRGPVVVRLLGGGGDGVSFWGCLSATRGTTNSELEQIGKHTSELQSHSDLVCRLLLEKKKKYKQKNKKYKKKTKKKLKYNHLPEITYIPYTVTGDGYTNP